MFILVRNITVASILKLNIEERELPSFLYLLSTLSQISGGKACPDLTLSITLLNLFLGKFSASI